jgi:hypothetical protein
MYIMGLALALSYLLCAVRCALTLSFFPHPSSLHQSNSIAMPLPATSTPKLSISITICIHGKLELAVLTELLLNVDPRR